MNRYSLFLIIMTAFLGIVACNTNPLKVNISDIDVSLKINRFDQDLYAIPLDSIEKHIPLLEEKYSDFFNLYNNKIINIGSTNQEEYIKFLHTFLTDFTIHEIYKVTNKEFDDISWLEEELITAFKHYKYYFPEQSIPDIYTHVSGFNQSIVTAEDFVGISLDKYLGQQHDLYNAMGIPLYLRYKMEPKRIPIDVLTAWCITEFPFDDKKNNLLSHIIYNGKTMYFNNAMFPNTNDTLLIGYSLKQHEWCKDYEKDMWSYLIEHKLLFSSDLMDIKRFTEEAPFTSVLSQESPGRTGIWIGWQIVKSYMKQNPDVTLNDLMKNDNYQEILNLSKYNP